MRLNFHAIFFFEGMLLPDIAGPAHNVALIVRSNQICAMLSAYCYLGSYARLVGDMGEGISKGVRVLKLR